MSETEHNPKSEPCEHNWRVVGIAERVVAGFDFIEVCERGDCGAWRRRSPKVENQVVQEAEEQGSQAGPVLDSTGTHSITIEDNKVGGDVDE